MAQARDRDVRTTTPHEMEPDPTSAREPAPPTAARARIMSAVRGRRNKTTELALASLLRRERIRGWRRHQALPGRPDFLFRRERVAIFVDGCFWHGCPRCYLAPARNAAFWADKVARNRARDRRVSRRLRGAGWAVVRIWEHDLKAGAGRGALARVRKALERGAAARGGAGYEASE